MSSKPMLSPSLIQPGCIVVALLWSGLLAAALGSEVEPIIGSGWMALVWVFGLNLVSGYGVLWACWNRAWKAGCVLVPLGLLTLFFSFPGASKAGATIAISNQTSAQTEVRISRADRPSRSALLKVAAGGQMKHRTAPGDYSEAIEVEFVVGASRLTASIGQLRTNQVAVTASGLRLVELRRGEL